MVPQLAKRKHGQGDALVTMKLVFPGGDKPQALLDLGTYRIGSAPDADVPLAGEGVAPLHGELFVGHQGVQLRVPKDSVVLVNGRRVDGVIALRPNDMLGFGQNRLRLIDGATQLSQFDERPSVGGDPQATLVRPVVPKFALRALSGKLFGRSFPLNEVLSVGRADEAGLRIPQDSISRQHARLTPAGDDVLVEDLGSANGTWVNGRRITRARAGHGDEIRFDKERFQLVMPGRSLPAQTQAEEAPASRGWAYLVLVLVAVIVVAALWWFR